MIEIPVSSGLPGLVDDNFAYLIHYKWSEGRYGRRGQIYIKCNDWPFLMHLFVLPPRKGFVVDHIDNNPRNNQTSNLRYLSNGDNIARQPKVRGFHSGTYKGVQCIGG